MTDVGRWLRDADPLARGRDGAEALSALDARAMRRAMVDALDVRQRAALSWPAPLAIAATIVLTLTAGVVVGRRLAPPRDGSNPRTVARAWNVPVAGERRQLQFATPGGTRVIWVFNPEFEP
jgi:hypothetical protein